MTYISDEADDILGKIIKGLENVKTEEDVIELYKNTIENADENLLIEIMPFPDYQVLIELYEDITGIE